jgi:predicted  nucleic acid-binding Zn-ribbon protein|tara:strand:- start:945 stop:1463 length:519 start_codon:yes stop_codon:yes gene_type:complete
MAEVEYKGIKIGGSKLLLILPLIGTLGGGLWGGFELFTRYQSMEKKINSYAAPDLSGFDKRLSVLLKQMVSVRESVSESTDYTRDIKNNLKNDILRLEKQVDAAERRSKDAFKLVRESTDKNDSKVRKMITDSSARFDTQRATLRDEMRELGKRVDGKIKKALENPLANLRK